MLVAYSPEGHRIDAVAERILVTAWASVLKDPETGKIEIDYEGESEIHWDTQVPDEQDGQTVYVCTARVEWLESQLVWKEEADD